MTREDRATLMDQFQAATTSGNIVRFNGAAVVINGESGSELATIPLSMITIVTRTGRELFIQTGNDEPSRLTFVSMLDAERLEYLLTSRGASSGVISHSEKATRSMTPWLKTASGKALLASLIVAVTLVAITIVLCISLAVMLDEVTDASAVVDQTRPLVGVLR